MDGGVQQPVDIYRLVLYMYMYMHAGPILHYYMYRMFWVTQLTACCSTEENSITVTLPGSGHVFRKLHVHANTHTSW